MPEYEFTLNLIFPYKAESATLRSSRPDVFLGKGVLKICSTFTVEHPCGSAISIKFCVSKIL